MFWLFVSLNGSTIKSFEFAVLDKSIPLYCKVTLCIVPFSSSDIVTFWGNVTLIPFTMSCAEYAILLKINDLFEAFIWFKIPVLIASFKVCCAVEFNKLALGVIFSNPVILIIWFSNELSSLAIFWLVWVFDKLGFGFKKPVTV